jgi:hypothetical protein
MPWLAFLGLLPLGAIVTVLYDRLSGRREERLKLRREGSSVATPAKELVNGLGPDALIWGTDEQLSDYLNDCYRKWWDELRGPLMIYLNHHPSDRVRRIGEEFATSVQVALAATRYHLATRKTATTMREFEEADEAKKKSLALADELLTEIRRQWPRWLQLPTLRWLRRADRTKANTP